MFFHTLKKRHTISVWASLQTRLIILFGNRKPQLSFVTVSWGELGYWVHKLQCVILTLCVTYAWLKWLLPCFCRMCYSHLRLKMAVFVNPFIRLGKLIVEDSQIAAAVKTKSPPIPLDILRRKQSIQLCGFNSVFNVKYYLENNCCAWLPQYLPMSYVLLTEFQSQNLRINTNE